MNDEIINSNSKFIACYKEPEGYFLDESIKKYKPCYHSCKYCLKEGEKKNHYCLSCNDNNNYPIPMENNDYNNAGYSLFNCFPNCKYNFYFNDNNDYICLNKSGCLPNMKYLIDGQKQCIKTCKGTKYIYEFRQKCFESCPEESIPFSNKTGNYCISICPLEKPFELIEEEVCTSFCTINN